MKNLKKTKLFCIYSILMLINLSCSLKGNEQIFLIPEGYSGDVKIFWNNKKSKNKIFCNNDNQYLFFLNGNLSNFRLNDKPIPSGLYDIKYFYYSKDTIYQISSAGYNYLPEKPGAGNGYWGETNGEVVYGFRVNSGKRGNDK